MLVMKRWRVEWRKNRLTYNGKQRERNGYKGWKEGKETQLVARSEGKGGQRGQAAKGKAFPLDVVQVQRATFAIATRCYHGRCPLGHGSKGNPFYRRSFHGNRAAKLNIPLDTMSSVHESCRRVDAFRIGLSKGQFGSSSRLGEFLGRLLAWQPERKWGSWGSYAVWVSLFSSIFVGCRHGTDCD